MKHKTRTPSLIQLFEFLMRFIKIRRRKKLKFSMCVWTARTTCVRMCMYVYIVWRDCLVLVAATNHIYLWDYISLPSLLPVSSSQWATCSYSLHHWLKPRKREAWMQRILCIDISNAVKFYGTMWSKRPTCSVYECAMVLLFWAIFVLVRL